MEKLDFYEQMKLEIVKMDIEAVNNVVNIVAMPLYCPWILNDENLEESYSRLIDINDLNVGNLMDLISFIKHNDSTNGSFFVTDLDEEFSYLKDNMLLQDYYYNNMLEYINFCDDYTNTWNDIEKFSNNYILKDDKIFDQVQVNHSLIKMIKKERKS